ncbi:hypothetical protein WESB_2542 [Brachyspira pilosicoli WesB]|uniref:Lipoprotein n=1 Tax=Brachyspira pilosicoli WesB TaxID=1161918 RepID=K0JLQ7_BRAPL|nr:hypothetical protein [Brachyspira pilosicoli]CCG58004.1 hypothetical protein WESB_2542 [Brachyspira pilosicoli WesB]
MKKYLIIICLIFIILSCAGSPTDSTTDNNNNNIALKDRAGRYTTDTLQMVLFNDGIINFIDSTGMLGAYKVGDANDTKTEFTFYGISGGLTVPYILDFQNKILTIGNKEQSFNKVDNNTDIKFYERKAKYYLKGINKSYVSITDYESYDSSTKWAIIFYKDNKEFKKRLVELVIENAKKLNPNLSLEEIEDVLGIKYIKKYL